MTVNRRNFLRGVAGGALGAAVGALTLKRGIGLPEAERGAQGQPVGALMSMATWGGVHYVAPMGSASRSIVAGPFPDHDPAFPIVRTSDTNWAVRDTNGGAAFGEMTLVTGPDPDTMAHIRFDDAENATVVPPGMETPNEFLRTWAIPRTLFPEYDPANGVVPLPMFEWSHSGDDDLALLRASYLHAVGQRQPDRPLDGNHLSTEFMPKALYSIWPYLNGEKVKYVTESYSGPNGWLVQMVANEKGPIIFGDSIRYRLLTGNVELRIDDALVWPGDYTAPLLR